MTEKGRKYLSDIQSSIELIELFLDNIDSFESYVNDLKTQSAVERQLGIIGEAVARFSRECPEVQLENTRQIIGLRNRIIHAYGSIDNSIVWVILKKHIDPLKLEVMREL